MLRWLCAALVIVFCSPALGQQVWSPAAQPPCSAFGATIGTCAQGNDSRITGAAQTGTANTFTQRNTINLNSASLPTPQTGTALQIGQANGTATRAELDSWAMPSFFTGVRGDGTAASPTALVNNDQINGINAFGYDGTSYGGPWSSFRCYAGANWTNLVHGTYCGVAVTANGATASMADVVQFTPTGIQWPATTAPFSGQDINDQKGTSFNLGGGTAYAGLLAELSDGTSGAPVTVGGPVFKISKVESIIPGAGNPGCNSNAVDNTCNAAFFVGVQGLVTDQMQPDAFYAQAFSPQTACAGGNSCNTVAGRFLARITGANPFKSSGALFISEINSTANNAGGKGIEVDINNNDANNLAQCQPNYTQPGNCDGGVFISNGGNQPYSMAVHINDGSSPFIEGFTVNAGAVTGTTFNDHSSSAISLNIDGTHAAAAINVVANAGVVGLNGNNLLGAGSITMIGGAPPSVVAGAVGLGSQVTANTNCGTLAGSAGCLEINVAGTYRFIPYY